MRASAGIALWKIAGRTDGVAALAGNLAVNNLVSMNKALATLGEMGSAASPALGAVQHLCKFVNPEIREPAMATLRKIDPETAGSIAPSGKP